MVVDFELELVWIPVSDVDRAKRFYLEQAGFDLLVDIPNGLPGQRIVQVTPPGSACSIGFGTGVTPAKPGSQQGLFIVADIFAARDELRTTVTPANQSSGPASAGDRTRAADRDGSARAARHGAGRGTVVRVVPGHYAAAE
jgi:catechol 2,3-dioxygenase-like lactoylglutathione lyase family enzyme